MREENDNKLIEKGIKPVGLISSSSFSYLIFVIPVSLVFFAFTILFLFFPRSEYSELEKRELATFPNIGDYKNRISEYPAAISSWFSDSQPFRDSFMSLSMIIRDALKFHMNDGDAISFHKTDSGTTQTVNEVDSIEYDNPSNPMAEENAKMANAGVIVAGNAPNARAIMAFGGSSNSGGKFIEVVNEYARTFPQCNIYALVASSAGEFYLPDKARNLSKPEEPTLNHIRNSLSDKVKFVNVHDALARHINEDIFLRTDHHWAPLGAFYAAQEFAKTAGLAFKDLDSYTKHVVHDFVGSMFGYSKDIAVKKSPEDFIYYTPKDIDYKATYITYTTNSNYEITSESKPYQSEFFKTYKDGHGGAYNTFIGGDQHLVHVSTNQGTRKLLLIKDSFGNAIPGYLFYSFSDIFVVDFRYFNRNMKKFIAENGITDILFTFNIFNACNSTSMKKVNNFLTQEDRPKPAKKTEALPEDKASEITDSLSSIKQVNEKADVPENNSSGEETTDYSDTDTGVIPVKDPEPLTDE